MTIQVYCDPCTVNSRKVLAGLEEIKADYKQNYINYFTGEHKSDAFVKINPHATVPAATDGDLTITESNAILMYAAEKSGNDAMYPKDLKKRADVNRWLLWEASSWFPTCYIYLVENVVKPLMKGHPDQKVIDAEAEKFHRSAGILEARLSKNKWLTGDHVTIADIAVAAPMHIYTEQKLPLDKYPNLKRWMTDGIEQLEGWKNTQAPVDKALFPNGVRTPASVRTVVNYTKAVGGLTEIYIYESDKAKDIHAEKFIDLTKLSGADSTSSDLACPCASISETSTQAIERHAMIGLADRLPMTGKSSNINFLTSIEGISNTLLLIIKVDITVHAGHLNVYLFLPC